VAIGARAKAIYANNIVLNAMDTELVASQPGGFYVRPVRFGAVIGNLAYDLVRGEIVIYASSRRYKTDIVDVEASESASVFDLRPVSYRAIDADESASKMYGFIAEEVEEVDPRLCFYGKDEEGQPRVEGVNYDMVIPLLLQEMKLQQQEMKALRARIEVLEGQLAAK
jgi:hypothetical protein